MLTERFDDALVFARQRHNTQTRKGGGSPYVSHLLGVASLVLEAGGDEDQAIAGLLHDALENFEYTGVTYDELVGRFGERVARIVRDCSDAEPGLGEDKLPWRPRKEAYIASLAEHDDDSLLVSNADKLHNARSILVDYERLGPSLWERFNPEADQLWYYRSLVAMFHRRQTPLAGELERIVTQLVALVERTDGA
ncbi:MAG: HD domain-containing protein [Acidimicrobiia bacterium]